MTQLVAALLLMAVPASAQLSDKVKIHGFGGWAYGETDGNLFLIGDQDGNYKNAEFSLNLTAAASDRVSVIAQLFFGLQDAFGGDEDVDVDLDYVFVQYVFSDLAKLRVGRVKHPYGIYTEVANVGTVRPFYTLPQSIYGPQGIVNQAYNGVGVTGSRGGGAVGWGFQYDVYGGQLDTEIQFPGVLSSNAVRDFQKARIDRDVEVTDMIGARFNVLAPVEGLLFGVSAYDGDSQIEADPDATSPRSLGTQSQTVYGGHVDYTGDRLWVRVEWSDFDRESFLYEGIYAELAYKLDRHWQLALRWDDWSAEIPGVDTSTFPSFFLQVLEHQEVALGVNYWFTPSVVLRLSYHMAEGNRFAFPESPEEILQSILTNDLEEDTDLVVFGMQFSF